MAAALMMFDVLGAVTVGGAHTPAHVHVGVETTTHSSHDLGGLASTQNNRPQHWDGTFPTGTQIFRNHAARIDSERGLLNRVDDLLGQQ